MVNGVQRSLLRVWRYVPHPFRRWIVRVGAPSYTVGAACVIERDDGSILLVRLSYREGWGLPGGLIERREDVADCARREVREEVGLAVDLVGAPAVVVDSRPQRVDVVFRARPADGAAPDRARPASAEIREARWFAAQELPTLQHEAVSALLALAASARLPSAGGSSGGGDEGAQSDGDGSSDDGRGAVLLRAAAQAARQRGAVAG